MVDTIKRILFKSLYAELMYQTRKQNTRSLELDSREREIDEAIAQRVAEIVSKMDPFEPAMKLFHGIFSDEFEHPEDKLAPDGHLQLTMWAYQQSTDPAFKHLTEWVMNSAGNETVKRAPVTVERTLYGRAQIASMVLFVKEVNRLGAIYEDLLDKQKLQTFDEHITVEE